MHFGHRSNKRICTIATSQPGDIIFFKWKRESVYNHAGVVTAYSGGRLYMAQHGIANRTTLEAVLARYRGTANPISDVLILRPLGAS